MEVWVISGLIAFGFLGYAVLLIVAGTAGRKRRLRKRDERRHSEQLAWRDGGQLPVRYVTTYWSDEAADEDMARMLELGYYVADEVVYVNGSRQVVYRLEGTSAL